MGPAVVSRCINNHITKEAHHDAKQSGIGAGVLIGGLVLANYGSGVSPAEATGTLVNPFPIIIAKLNQILEKLSMSGGGGNHTLRWDTNNASADRFTTAFTGAVLDKNTGLVWEQAPDAATQTWNGATFHCVNRTVGGTVGWRLPSVVELKSVQDRSLPPPLVPGTIFTGVQSARYWSATTFADGLSTTAWTVFFLGGDDGFGSKTASNHAWCVRGGMNADAY